MLLCLVPPVDMSSSSTSGSKLSHLPSKFGSPPLTSRNIINSTTSAPVPIISAETSKEGRLGCLGSHNSAPSGTWLGSLDVGDASEQPSTDYMTRIKSLQHCASTITKLVNEKLNGPDNCLATPYWTHVQWDLLAVAPLKLNNVLCAIRNQTVPKIKQKFPVQIRPYLILITWSKHT